MNSIKSKYKIFIITCLALLFNTILPAQNYPVKATLQVTPPYSGYLLDYTDESNEKLKVLLTLNDVNVNSYAVKLLFSIEGNGYSIKTKSTFLASPITLQGGVPELLGAYELNTYFSTNNLQFTGLSTNIYEQNKSLPEGYYTISVTAYDYSSAEPKQVSNTATTSAWFTLSDPPQPIAPACGEQINVATSSQVIFQWLNQSVSPYGQNNTEYVLQLFEVRPDTKNPNDAIQSSFPVFSTTIEQPIFVYGPAEIPLIEGMLYSTVCTFRYGSKYAALESQVQLTLQANVQTHRMVMASWDSIPEFTDYTLLYKKASGTYNWREVKLSEARKKIADLEPNTTYQAKVKGHVEDYTSPESNTVTFTTLPASSYSCTAANGALNPSELNIPLLQKAEVDMIIQVGLFEMQLTQVTGANGIYSGKGIMLKGMFGFPVLVKFDNIKINDNQVMVDGEVNAISKSNSKMFVNADVLWERVQELTNQIKNNLANGNVDAANQALDSILKIYPDTSKLAQLTSLVSAAEACGMDCDRANKENDKNNLQDQGGKGNSNFFMPEQSDCTPCYTSTLNFLDEDGAENNIVNQNIDLFQQQSFLNPLNLKRYTHKDAICFQNEDDQTIAFILPDGKTFCWVNDGTWQGYFLNGNKTQHDSYVFYVEDKINRIVQPISWGIYLAAYDFGGFALTFIDNPTGTVVAMANGVKKIVTLDFDLEKTWDRVCNADLTDASYITSTFALAYLAGPKGKATVTEKEIAPLVEEIETYIVKTRPVKLTWPQILVNFKLGNDFGKRIANLISVNNTAYLTDVAQKVGITLQELRTYTPLKELQLNLANGGYVVLDNVWVKTININGKLVKEIIANENKLAALTKLSKRQTQFLNELSSNSNFTVRSIADPISSILTKNSSVKIKSFIKTAGDGSVNGAYTITKLK
jgi:hypothetical protein